MNELFALLMQMFTMAQGGQGQQLDKILAHLDKPKRSRIAQSEANMRSYLNGGTGNALGGPGLSGFYANNPHIRPGEPVERANARRMQGYAQQDRMTNIANRTAYGEALQGLYDVWEGLPENSPKIGGIAPRESPAFYPLFPNR